MDPETTKTGDKPQGDDALQAMQNQLNDLAKDWEAYKASLEERIAPVLELGKAIDAMIEAQKNYDLEITGLFDSHASHVDMLRALLQQSLGLSAIVTQIMGNAVQSDIGENQRGLNGRTKLLLDMLASLEPHDPAVAAAVAGEAGKVGEA